MLAQAAVLGPTIGAAAGHSAPERGGAVDGRCRAAEPVEGRVNLEWRCRRVDRDVVVRARAPLLRRLVESAFVVQPDVRTPQRPAVVVAHAAVRVDRDDIPLRPRQPIVGL
eukprot:2265182-Prymnesium_polylepis.1